MEGCLYRCVLKDNPAILPYPVPLQQTSLRRSRGTIVSLEHGMSENLIGLLRTQDPNQNITLTRADVCLRLPLPFAYLVSLGKWKSFLLPALEGRQLWYVNWKNLGIRKLPSLPDLVVGIPCTAGLSPEVAQSIGDILRTHEANSGVAGAEVHRLFSITSGLCRLPAAFCIAQHHQI